MLSMKNENQNKVKRNNSLPLKEKEIIEQRSKKVYCSIASSDSPEELREFLRDIYD